ncbi:primosomal protein N' [Patescibacteria group bacterium]
MHIITVYPLGLTHTSAPEQLSYFSQTHIERGILVAVNFGTRKIFGIVAKSEPAIGKKILIKKAEFKLKKINKIISPSLFFSNILLNTIEELSEYFLKPCGMILKTFLPAKILLTPPAIKSKKNLEKSSEGFKHIIAVGTIDERIKFYTKRISEDLKNKKSVLIMSPALSGIEYMSSSIENASNKKPIIIHGKLAKKTLIKNWESALTESPSVIIGTQFAFGIINDKISTIIMDSADHSYFMQENAPFLNLRKFVRMTALKNKIQFIEGVAMPSPEDMFLKTQKTAVIENLHAEKTKTVFIDMQKEKEQNKTFPIISNALKNEVLNTKGRIILFINRRGHSPLVLCKDCGSAMTCPHCTAPLVMHENLKLKQRELICHHCQKTIPISIKCANCSSWNMATYGIGTQRVEQELRQLIPNRKILRIDTDSVKNEAQKQKIRDDFLESSNSILIGTEMILEEPAIKSELTGIIGIDHMLSMPDFRMNYEILRLLTEFKIRSKKLILQSFLKDNEMIRAFLNEKTGEYFLNELNERQKEHLPPFSLIIKLTGRNKNRDTLISEARAIEKQIKTLVHFIDSSPAFISKAKNLFHWNILIYVNPKQWPEEKKLANMLKNIKSEWNIIIEPRSIL